MCQPSMLRMSAFFRGKGSLIVRMVTCCMASVQYIVSSAKQQIVYPGWALSIAAFASASPE